MVERLYYKNSRQKYLDHIHTKFPSAASYRDSYDAVGGGIVYYYSKQGLRVFRPHGGPIEVSNGHFFTRYNERLELNIHRQLDVVKRFFHESGYLTTEYMLENGRPSTRSVCKEGIALGTYVDGATPWLVHNTFISHDLKRQEQKAFEKQTLRSMQIELTILRANPQLNIDRTYYMNTANAVNQILGKTG